MNQMSGECRPSFTPKQGQYLAFIDAYTRVHRRPPAEREMQRHFGVTPPSVHQMVLNLERAGLIRRQPGVPRSIEVLVPPEDLPVLQHMSSRSKPLCRGTSWSHAGEPRSGGPIRYRYPVTNLTMIQARVATRTLPASRSSKKRPRCGLFQRANDEGPFRQILRCERPLPCRFIWFNE